MKKFYFIFVVLIIIFIFFETPSAEEITIVGTGSGMSLLKKIGSSFTQYNPGVNITVPASIGSGGGVKTVGNNQFTIGRVAREIKEKEKHYGLSYVPFARMPIVMMVNKNTKVRDLTTAQVCSIFSGEVTNWQTVGGNDRKIKVVRREDGDSSLKTLLESFPGFNKIKQTIKSKTTFTDQETCHLVEVKIGTIAYSTLLNVVDYNVGVLSINNITPTSKNYPYIGTLAFVFKKENYTGNLKKFVEFATSVKVHEVIKIGGGIPVY